MSIENWVKKEIIGFLKDQVDLSSKACAERPAPKAASTIQSAGRRPLFMISRRVKRAEGDDMLP